MDEALFTAHFIERYVQRTRKKYKHIHKHEYQGNSDGCEECLRLKREAIEEYRANQDAIEREFTSRFWSAKEVEIPHQTRKHERDGMSRYFRHGVLTFAVDISRKTPAVVTCFSHDMTHRIAQESIVRTGNRKKR